MHHVALKCAGFEQLDEDNLALHDEAMEDESTCSFKYNESDSFFECSKLERNKQAILFDFDNIEDSGVFSSCNIVTKYFELFDNLSELLHLAMEEVFEAVDNLMASEINHIKLFSTDFIECLKECTNATEALRTLFPYSNWYDHSILRWLLENCKCPEGLKLLNKFDTEIDFTLPIKDYPLPVYQSSYMIPDVSSAHTVLIIRCEQQLSSLSLQHIGVVKSAILQAFDITDHACILLTATNYTSYWLIPQNIVALICNKVQEHSAYLYDNKILEISVYPDFTFSTDRATEIQSLGYSSDIITTLRHVRTLRCSLHVQTYHIFSLPVNKTFNLKR